MLNLWKFLCVMALFFSCAGAKEFVVDNTHSNVGFTIKHMMISNVKGSFENYSADIEYDTDKKVFTKLDAKINAASINTGITKRDDHLRSADFFDATKFKTVDFVMTRYEAGKVYGNITIHGVTKEIVLNTTVHGLIKDFQGHQRIGFSMEGELNRKDFGLKWNKILEGGGLTVDDTVKIAIEIEAIEL